MAEQECAHPDCECMVDDNGGVTLDEEIYCSRYCAKCGPESQSKECECGHAECV